jgi:transcriptional regulator with XRE-family HTH domain
MPAMGELGHFIRKRRLDLGLTLEEVAGQVGVSHQAISQLERGERKGMRLNTARRLARALEVSTDDLMDRIPEAPMRDPAAMPV